jgi:hypothetical protein
VMLAVEILSAPVLVIDAAWPVSFSWTSTATGDELARRLVERREELSDQLLRRVLALGLGHGPTFKAVSA